MSKKTSSELIVITCLALMLIWIVFWNVPLLYLSFTAIALAVSVWAMAQQALAQPFAKVEAALDGQS